jgi:hypothetical protein
MGGHDVCHCKSLQGNKYNNLEFQALAKLSNFARIQSSKVLQA